MYLVFDTETTGIPLRKNAPITDLPNWPRLVQIAWQLHNQTGKLILQENKIINPEGFDIPFEAEKIHGISTAYAEKNGEQLIDILHLFAKSVEKATCLVGHNVAFDINIVGAEYVRTSLPYDHFINMPRRDTGILSTTYCGLSGGPGGRLKMPRLTELYEKLFDNSFEHAHDASYDVHATARCFFSLIKEGIIDPLNPLDIQHIKYEAPVLPSQKIIQENCQEKEEVKKISSEAQQTLDEQPFCHLHVHSQFSVLQATPSIKNIINQAKKHTMSAVALTDLGNMYGAFQFADEAKKNQIKAIIGSEFFVAEERKKLTFKKDNPDKRFNQLLFAKNKIGYSNLIRLSSLGFTEGLYGLYPRIDKELIVAHREGLIAVTGGLSGEIPRLILRVGEKQAKEAFRWWHELFQEDFYVELNRHGLPEEDRVNQTMIRFCEEYHVNYFGANEVYYLEKEDSEAHDVLLCIKEGEFKSTPIGRGRGFRYGMPNNEFYFKSQDEMRHLFRDLPEAISTIQEIVNKIESYDLHQAVVLPNYALPEGTQDENDYLKLLTYEGAKKRYEKIDDTINDRILFELDTIKNTGYPGYFLIVQDITKKAKEIGVSVGPGRGSAAGSVVAYCIGITNVDPIAYHLLFERFLNPDRISLPDIDIDFDDEGRDKVLNYIIEKYGRNKVAQIITYGRMAARSSIRDSARIMELSLPETNSLAKLTPNRPSVSLKQSFAESTELRQIKKEGGLKAQVLEQASVLEGSLRNIATHACGVIIAPKEIVSMVPVLMTKDSSILITQYDNSTIEQAGMLKMDLLGLTTLSIIKTALRNIKKRHGITIDIDRIPLDDKKTFQLYQRGDTMGIFQFESEGMQAYLRDLKPDKIEDLIAMNALYRPGPIEYIPNFIARKNKKEKVSYDLPEMEEILRDTYGITVYQEQVMLLSQKLANFSKGDADVLRKAMGKKQKDVLDKMKHQFVDGCKKNQHDQKIVEKIWKDWEAFSQYAFNKSHSTCYSLIAYHTGYLKANYLSDYMAALLTHTKNNLDKVSFLMEDCRKNKLVTLGPDINESGVFFEVNKEGKIRFGLSAIKGIGEGIAESISKQREQHGVFKNIFDFSSRLNQQTISKKTLESLALSGAFDCFPDVHRRQFVDTQNGDSTLIDKLIRHTAKTKQESLSGQTKLFDHVVSTLPPPKLEAMEPFGELEKLRLEKEFVGIYISGHPLDSFKFEIDSFCTASLHSLTSSPEEYLDKTIKLGGIVASVEHRITRHGKPFGKMTLEDYSGKCEFMLWSDKYIRFKNFLMPGWFLFVEGSVYKKAWGDQALELNIKNIELLNELAKKRIKGLQLSIPVLAVTPPVIDRIESLCKEFSGECPLYISVKDQKKKIDLEMLSMKFRINPVNNLIEQLKEIPTLSIGIIR